MKAKQLLALVVLAVSLLPTKSFAFQDGSFKAESAGVAVAETAFGRALVRGINPGSRAAGRGLLISQGIVLAGLAIADIFASAPNHLY
jgi:hypothetical protein